MKKTAYNSTFAIGGASCLKDTSVIAKSFVLRIKFSGKKTAHRKCAKRYKQSEKQHSKQIKLSK